MATPDTGFDPGEGAEDGDGLRRFTGSLYGVHHRIQRFVVHRDEFQCVLGDVAVLGHHGLGGAKYTWNGVLKGSSFV